MAVAEHGEPLIGDPFRVGEVQVLGVGRNLKAVPSTIGPPDAVPFDPVPSDLIAP